MSADFPVVASPAGPLAGAQLLDRPQGARAPGRKFRGDAARSHGSLARSSATSGSRSACGPRRVLGRSRPGSSSPPTRRRPRSDHVPEALEGPQPTGPIRADESSPRRPGWSCSRASRSWIRWWRSAGWLRRPRTPRIVRPSFGSGRRRNPSRAAIASESTPRASTTPSSRKTDGAVMDTGTVGDSIGRPIGFRWAPAAAHAQAWPHLQFQRHHAARRVDRAAQEAETAADGGGNSNFMSVTLVDTDKVEAAATLNSWLTEFDSTALWLKRRNVSEYSKLLGVQRSTPWSACAMPS